MGEYQVYDMWKKMKQWNAKAENWLKSSRTGTAAWGKMIHWKLIKLLKYSHTVIWNLLKSEFISENVAHKIIEFKIETIDKHKYRFICI